MDEMAWTTGSVAGKARTLRALLARTLAEGPVGIACSGGLDSRLLAHLAALTARAEGLALPLLAHLSGPHVPKAETASAVAWAGREGLALRLVAINPLEHPAVARNGRDRCYHCKKRLFSALAERARELGFPLLADGANRDDRGDYRPGARAADELGILHPLSELPKSAIRELARELDVPAWNLPAAACLASRIPTGTPLNREALAAVEAGERALAALGYSGFRVRRLGPESARLELRPEEMERAEREWTEICSRLGACGFTTVEAARYRTGSMNRIPEKNG